MQRVLRLLVAVAILASACGGSDTTEVADTTTTTLEPSTTTVETTTEAPTTTTTTEAPTTTTTEAPAEALTDADLAELIVLESGFFGADWDEQPQTDSSFDYSTIEDCGFFNELRDADGNLVEVNSPEFNQLDTRVEHSVRVYPDAETAIDVVVAWAQDPVLQCTLDGAIVQAQETLDAGELAPFTGVDFDINRYDDLVGEPRSTNFEIKNLFTTEDGEEFVLFFDQYFIQVGRSVSRVAISNPDAIWDSTDRLLDEVVARMAAADEADGA